MIDKKKIIKYGGVTLISSLLIGGTLLKIADSHVNHTTEICPITKALSIVVPYKDSDKKDKQNNEYSDFTLGLYHQIAKIKDYYQDLRKNVEVGYKNDYQEKNIETVIAKEIENQDGEIDYIVPVGYTLETYYVCVKTDETGKTLEVPAHVTYTSDGEQYNVPLGYEDYELEERHVGTKTTLGEKERVLITYIYDEGINITDFKILKLDKK